MTKDYSKSKIYKLVSPQTDKIYIGSSQLKYLSTRLATHKQAFKAREKDNKNAFELLKYDDTRIELIENYPCKDINELNTRERHYINLHKDICVNA